MKVCRKALIFHPYLGIPPYLWFEVDVPLALFLTLLRLVPSETLFVGIAEGVRFSLVSTSLVSSSWA